MQVIKHQDLREFMLSLDHEEQDTLAVLVKFCTQYVYTARIIYDPYSRCWRCISNQTTGGSIHATAYDYRNVRVYIAREVKPYQSFALEDIHISDEECTLTTLSSWATGPSTGDSFTVGYRIQ